MCQRKLKRGHTVSEQIPEKRREKHAHFPVYFQFLKQLKQAIGNERTCDCHGKCICPQCGQSAMCQEHRLEDQHDDPKHAHRRRSQKDGAKSCPCHVGTAPCDRGDLER